MKRHEAQRGAVLLVGLLILMTAMAAGLMTLFGQRFSESRRVAHDANVLAEAKSALIAYSIANDLSSSLGNKRPGSLPCPDKWPSNSASVGTVSPSCGGNALGRLPWKDLGLPDLRDSSGERLWYAVSDRFRRTNPILTAGGINPDTFGRISVRGSDGVTVIASADTPSGAAAVIIAPGAAIRRLDGLMQNRISANYNNPRHYLDCLGAGCAIEDNADFVNGNSTNGFVAGPVKSGGEVSVVNDRILPLSATELMTTVNRAVARAVLTELNRSMQKNGFLPRPADIGDVNCLGRLTIPSMPPPGRCVPGAGDIGRLPATPPSSWGSSTTFLDGDASSNWFQSNSWREHVFYAISPACTVPPLCTVGTLQVNNPPYATVSNAKVVVLVGGVAFAFQSRSVKTLPSNYLEDENQSWGNSVFARRLPVGSSASFNDVVEVLQ